jgi:restriction system protein
MAKNIPPERAAEYIKTILLELDHLGGHAKHRDNKVSVKEVRELEGFLRRTGDIGLIVSSGGFSNEVEREIRASTKHIELMDLDRLIELWQQHYDNVREPGKALLPLVQLFILAPTEE